MSDGEAQPGTSMDEATTLDPGVETWAVSRLDLDPDNARLPEVLRDRSQFTLLRHFEEAYGLDEFGLVYGRAWLLPRGAIAHDREPD
jgi:hypothetical protein